MWVILISVIMNAYSGPGQLDKININMFHIEDSVLTIEGSIQNEHDFSVCIPRDQLPIRSYDAEIIILESEGGILYYQPGFPLKPYLMWVMLPPGAGVEFIAAVDLRYFDRAPGEVTGHLHISGLPCNQATDQTLISAPIPNSYYPDVSMYADEYIFFRSDFFSINLPDPD